MAFQFNSEKDKVLKKFKRKTWGTTRLRVTAHSYNEGEPKIQIIRQRRNSEDDTEWNFAKLGRLNYYEITWLRRIMKKEIIPWFHDFLDKPGKKKSKKE